MIHIDQSSDFQFHIGFSLLYGFQNCPYWKSIFPYPHSFPIWTYKLKLDKNIYFINTIWIIYCKILSNKDFPSKWIKSNKSIHIQKQFQYKKHISIQYNLMQIIYL